MFVWQIGTTSRSPKDLHTTTVSFPDVINPPSVHTHLIIIIMTQANFLPTPSLSATFTSLSTTFSSGPPSYTVVIVTHADRQHTVDGNTLEEREEEQKRSWGHDCKVYRSTYRQYLYAYIKHTFWYLCIWNDLKAYFSPSQDHFNISNVVPKMIQTALI